MPSKCRRGRGSAPTVKALRLVIITHFIVPQCEIIQAFTSSRGFRAVYVYGNEGVKRCDNRGGTGELRTCEELYAFYLVFADGTLYKTP
jgi:hypothetical protein